MSEEELRAAALWLFVLSVTAVAFVLEHQLRKK